MKDRGQVLMTWVSISALAAGKAWQTPFGMYAGVVNGKPRPGLAAAAVLLQLPLEGVLRGGGIASVLKRPPGANPEWLTGPHRRDIFVGFAEVRWDRSEVLGCLLK